MSEHDATLVPCGWEWLPPWNELLPGQCGLLTPPGAPCAYHRNGKVSPAEEWTLNRELLPAGAVEKVWGEHGDTYTWVLPQPTLF